MGRKVMAEELNNLRSGIDAIISIAISNGSEYGEDAYMGLLYVATHLMSDLTALIEELS